MMKSVIIWILIMIGFCSVLCYGINRNKKPPLPENISLETPKDYTDRMIETISYYIDIGYYIEASYLLNDLKSNNESGLNKGAITELQNRLNGLNTPDSEHSLYNSDILRVVKHFNGKYGYIDNNGNFVIEAKFDKADDFFEGLALVRIEKHYYFINRKGETVIDMDPDNENKTDIKSDFNSGLALYYQTYGNKKNKPSGYYYMDKQGNDKIYLPSGTSKFKDTYEPYGFSEGYAIVKSVEKGLYGYMDTDGKWLVEPSFAGANAFRNGMACIKYPGASVFGCINTSGQPAFKPFIRDGDGFSDEAALVTTKADRYSKTPDSMGGQYIYDTFLTLIDKSGNIIYDPSKEVIDKKSCTRMIYMRSDGLTAISFIEARRDNNKNAIIFIDKNNKRKLALIESIVLNNNYKVMDESQGVISFANGRAFIKTKYNGWGMIDMRGHFIVKPQEEWIPEKMFFNGLAKIKNNKDKSTGYINREGKIVYKE